MRSTVSPGIATWLLRLFGSSPNNESLIGDLAERYRQGQTRAWYWRQVLVAMVMSSYNDFRTNKLLGLRAAVLGFALLYTILSVAFEL